MTGTFRETGSKLENSLTVKTKRAEFIFTGLTEGIEEENVIRFFAAPTHFRSKAQNKGLNDLDQSNTRAKRNAQGASSTYNLERSEMLKGYL